MSIARWWNDKLCCGGQRTMPRYQKGRENHFVCVCQIPVRKELKRAILLIPCVARSHLMVRQKGQQLMTSIINCFISMMSPNIDSTMDHQSSIYLHWKKHVFKPALLLKCMCSYDLWYVYHICFTCGTSLHMKLALYVILFVVVCMLSIN